MMAVYFVAKSPSKQSTPLEGEFKKDYFSFFLSKIFLAVFLECFIATLTLLTAYYLTQGWPTIFCP
jgi:hypothetical protein